MTINKILLGETIRGMTNVHPLVTQKFYNRTAKETSRLYFPDAEKEFLENQGIYLNVDVDCEDAKKYLVASTSFYYDRNHNNTLDEGELAFNIHVYASKNGPKLKEAFECVTPKKGEMLIFIEDNKDDWSKQIVRIKIAKDVSGAIKKSDLHHSKVLDFINRKTEGEGLSQENFKQLVETGEIEEKFTVSETFFSGLGYVLALVFSSLKAVGWILEKTGTAAEYLKLPDNVWDTQNEDYLFKKENILSLLTIDASILDTLEQTLTNDKTKLEWNDLIPDFVTQKITSTINYLKIYIKKYNAFIEKAVASWFENEEKLFEFQGKIALMSGLYNGLIDFIVSTLQFLGNMSQTPFDVAYNWQDFLETIDNIWESITNIDWDVFWTSLSAFFETIKTKLINSKGEYDWVRLAYIIGFAVVFVGTMFIPIVGWVGKAAKLAKLENLIPKKLLETMQKALNGIKVAGKNAKQSGLRTIEKLFELFAKGGKTIKEFFSKLADDVANWFIKNKEKYKLVDKVDATLLGSIRILKSNPKFKDSIEYIKLIGRPLGKVLALESEAAINLYTKSYYILFNKALRKLDGVKLTKEFRAMQKVLDDALNK